MSKKVLFFVFYFIGIATLLFAQDTTTKAKQTVFTISADVYYRVDFAGKSENNKTSFTNSQNSFELGMASFRVDHSFGKVAATADIGLGRRTREFSYHDDGILQAIKQVYISYAPVSHIKFTAGKWFTHIGYEAFDAYLNRNYSMSYGFSYGPFFHTGIKTDIKFSEKTGLMLGMANPTDYISNTIDHEMFLAQLSSGLKNDRVKGVLNYQGGDDKSQFDLAVSGVVNDKIGIAYNGTLANIAGKSWSSNVVYLNYDPVKWLGFTLRGEYFDDYKGALNFNTAIMQSTLSANFRINNLTIIPELRYENAKQDIFINRNNNPVKTTESFLMAAVYKF